MFISYHRSLRRRMAPCLIAAALVLAAVAAPLRPAAAAEAASPWAQEEQVSLRLITARDALGSDGTVRAALQFRLQPGWKIYWRSPGDAGFPPEADFAASRNAKASDLAWPVPERFSVLGLETLGYKQSAVLPFTVTAPDPSRPAEVAATVRYLACDDICIPYEADLAMTLPPGGGEPSAFAHDIARADSLVPRPDSEVAAVDVEGLAASPGADARTATLRLGATADTPFEHPDAFFEGPPGLGYGKPEVTLSDDGRRVVLTVPVGGLDALEPAHAKNGLEGITFTATLVDGARAVEARLEAGPPGSVASDVAPAAAEAAPSLLTILAFAVLGGLILNLMPCVLPVLSIKLLSVVRHGGGHRGEVRASFLASAAGIVAAFMLLAGGLAGVKAAGVAVGWGIQFQQPWFLVAMLLAVTLFACNLFGFFEVRLPRAIADMGEHAGHVHGLGGHFLQGALATLLATPCSAPFLGTAVGFALSRGTVEIMAVFLALGLGLALPYLAVAARPGLATALPKPGPWMIWLRRALALALIATAVWLASVLATSTGLPAALAAAGAAAAATLFLALRHARPRVARPALAGVAAALVAAFALPPLLSGPATAPAPVATQSLAGKAWQPFERARIPELVAGGKTVFVDVTADWCITCQANKTLVLERGKVPGRLAADDVVLMRADWTRPDPRIAKYLADFGRYGIPFNVVYGPEAPDGVTLPELLSEAAVLDALDRAGTGNPGKAVAERR